MGSRALPLPRCVGWATARFADVGGVGQRLELGRVSEENTRLGYFTRNPRLSAKKAKRPVESNVSLCVTVYSFYLLKMKWEGGLAVQKSLPRSVLETSWKKRLSHLPTVCEKTKLNRGSKFNVLVQPALQFSLG